MKARLFLVVALSMSLGCQLKAPNATTGKPKPGAVTPTGASTLRVVDPADREANAAVKLAGLARILSDNGLGIISNNSGSIISNNGSGIISNGAAGYHMGIGSYRVAAGAARPESLLADATIEVLDAQGRALVDKARQPITAKTDKEGRYKLEGALPRENLVLRIRLWNGGVLTTILPNVEGEGEALSLDLNTASSLGATYVLEQYVKQRAGVLNLLPRTEAANLNKAMEAARGELAGTPSYKPADLVKATEDLRKKARGVDETLTRIEAIMLAGQADFGNGLPATQVPLTAVSGVAGDEAGNLYLAEATSRRIRRVTPDGVMAQLTLKGDTLGNPTAMVRGKDGSLYLACPVQTKIYKVSPDGTVSVYAGSGQKRDQDEGGVDIKATEAPLRHPTTLALAPDGTLYIGEVTKQGARKPRITYVDKDGILRLVPTTGPLWTEAAAGATEDPSVAGLAVTPDGTLIAGIRWGRKVAAWTRAGGWKQVGDDFGARDTSGLVIAPDGTIYAAASGDHVVWAYGPDGRRRVVAGNAGTSGASGDGGPATQALLNEPTGLWLSGDGALYVADSGNGLIRRVGKDGVITTVAGTTGLAEQGDVGSLGVNGPSGLAIDPQGRLVMAESGTASIKRLDGKTLSVMMGGTKLKDGDPNGDGGPADKARMIGPGHLAYFGNLFYFMDNGAGRLRRVDESGLVATLAGDEADYGYPFARRFAARTSFLALPGGLAVAPDGTPYLSDVHHHHIYKLVGDEIEIVAGSVSPEAGHTGDGGPAVDAKLNRPTALTFDAAGNMYFADGGNLVVRKIDKAGTISTIAGLGLQATLMKLFGFQAGTDEGAKATQSPFIVPMSLALDPEGNLYVGEAGTSNVDLLGDKLPIPASLIPKIGARVRKIAKDGTVTTVAGPGSKNMANGELLLPLGLIIDKQGRLIISDGAANQVWMLPKGSF